MKPSQIALGWLVAVAISSRSVRTGNVRTTRRRDLSSYTNAKSIPVTEMRTEQHKTFVPQTTTQYQSLSADLRHAGDSVSMGRAATRAVEPVQAALLDDRACNRSRPGKRRKARCKCRRRAPTGLRTTSRGKCRSSRIKPCEDEHKVAVSAAPTGALGGTAIASRPDSYGGRR